MFGLRFDFALTPRVFLRSHIKAFYLEFQDFRGALFNSKVAIEWNPFDPPFDHFGFGIGIENFRVAVEVKKRNDLVDFLGKVDFEYFGISLYGTVYF